MKKKFSLSSHLAKTWHYYILWLLFVVILWTWMYSGKTVYKENETVYLFFGTYTCKDSELYDVFKDDKPAKIKNIVIYSIAPNDGYFDSYYQTKCLLEADVLVLPESKCNKEIFRNTFCPLDKEYIESLFGACEYIGYNGFDFGIKVYDKETYTGVALSYLSYVIANQEEENFYMFFNKKSLHLGELRLRITDAAITLAKKICDLG